MRHFPAYNDAIREQGISPEFRVMSFRIGVESSCLKILRGSFPSSFYSLVAVCFGVNARVGRYIVKRGSVVKREGMRWFAPSISGSMRKKRSRPALICATVSPKLDGTRRHRPALGTRRGCKEHMHENDNEGKYEKPARMRREKKS